MSSGNILSRTFSRSGYFALATNEYPSLIRGGHNVVTVRIGTEKFECLNHDLHILIALNAETIPIHKDELRDGSIVIYDPHNGEPPAGFKTKVKFLAVPLNELVTKHQGDPIMRNTVALGATVALMGANFEKLSQVLSDMFNRKGPEVVNHNIEIAREGYDYIKNKYPAEQEFYLDKTTNTNRLLLVNGSEALGIGAVRAGLKFAAIYPMTPINALITFLADHAKELGIVYRQPEDEISGMNMALGASLTGVRSMVATSGGGFDLMVEALSWAGMIEASIVIDLGMRVGPSTGMPTWSEQGELQFAIHAGHGEFARIVLAPSDALETYKLAILAFNLADIFQIPVFLITDKYLNESQWCVAEKDFSGPVEINRGKLVAAIPENQNPKRFDVSSPDGISPRINLGTKNGFYVANSYEHDEVGFVTEKIDMRNAMVNKRLAKIKTIEKVVMPPAVFGDESSDTVIVSWGTTKGAILEALKLTDKKVKVVHYSWMYPFPTEATKKLLAGAKRIINIEQNATNQLAALIREHTGIEITEHLNKFDGRQLYPEEIIAKI